MLDKLQDTAKGPFNKLTISCIGTTGASGPPTGATAATFPITMVNNDTFKIFSGDHRVEGRIVAGDDCQITVSGVNNTEPVIEARHSKAKDQRRYVVSNAPTIDKVDVRGVAPSVEQAISLAAERSPTFQSLVTTIESTDGIVYVHRGRCGRQVLSCLLLAITKAGDYRLLHIRIDERRKDHDLMVSIAHELKHAIELLSDPTIVDSTSAQNFYHRGAAPKELYSFETEAAIETELRVDKELREWARTHKPTR